MSPSSGVEGPRERRDEERLMAEDAAERRAEMTPAPEPIVDGGPVFAAGQQWILKGAAPAGSLVQRVAWVQAGGKTGELLTIYAAPGLTESAKRSRALWVFFHAGEQVGPVSEVPYERLLADWERA